MGKKRYVQGRKLFWASLALLLVLVVLPASLGLVYWWNDQVAGTPATAWELNNETLGADHPYTSSSATISFVFYAGKTYNLAPFWKNDTQQDNEVLFPSYTENTSYYDTLCLVLNLSASQILNNNMDTLIIDFKGLYNETNQVHLTIRIQKHLATSDSDTYELAHNKVVNIINGTLHYEQKLDPAVMSYAKTNFEQGTYSDIVLTIGAINATDIIFPSNSIITFDIYALHPHGNLVVGGYTLMTVIIWLFTGLGIGVLFVTSPAWNPTTHNGLIDHMINRMKYAHSHRNSSRYRTHRSHHTHRTHRSSSRHRRTTHHRRRR